MIFTWSAPWRISSRTALRTSAVPSASPMAKCRASQQWQRVPWSVRRRPSLWPPVGPSALPAMNSLGPGSSHLSVASLRPQSAPPVSRTLVKPRSSMPRMSTAARAVIRVKGHVLEPGDGDLRQHHVHVAVDQARHQGAPAAIDHGRVRRLDRPRRDLLDALAFDEQLVAAAQLVVLGIEHLEVLEEELRHRCPRCAAEAASANSVGSSISRTGSDPLLGRPMLIATTRQGV